MSRGLRLIFMVIGVWLPIIVGACSSDNGGGGGVPKSNPNTTINTSGVAVIAPDTAANLEAALSIGRGQVTSNVAFHPDGNQFIVATAEGVWLYTLDESIAPRLVFSSADEINYIGFTPDGSGILTTAWLRQTIILWDTITGEQKLVFSGNNERINSFAVSLDGTLLISAGRDRTVRQWDMATGEEKPILRGNESAVANAVFNADGTQVMSGAIDGSVRIWDVASGEVVRTLDDAAHILTVNTVAFSPDGSRLLSGSDDDTMRLWDAETGRLIRIFEGHTGDVNVVAFTPDGQAILSGSDDDTVRLWDVETGEVRRVFEGLGGDVLSLALPPDGATFLVMAVAQAPRWIDIETGEVRRVIAEHMTMVTGLAFSADGFRLASSADDPYIRIWDTPSGTLLNLLSGHTDAVNAVAFDAEGSRLASGSADMTVRVWDSFAGVALQTLTGHTRPVTYVEFSDDGLYLLSESQDNTVRLWVLDEGLNLRTYDGARWGTFVNDDASVLIVDVDGSINQYSRETGELELSYPQPISTGRNRGLFVANTGLFLVGIGEPRIVAIDPNSGATLLNLDGHADDVTSMVLSPTDENLLFVGTQAVRDGTQSTLRLWDLTTGEALNVFVDYTVGVTQVAFSPTRLLLASGSREGVIQLWGLP